MRMLTDIEMTSIQETLNAVFAKNGIDQWYGDMLNPYLLEVQVQTSVGKSNAIRAFNDFFHKIGVLHNNDVLCMGEGRDYCLTCVNEGGNTYSALFNVPFAMDLNEDDEGYEFTIKAMNDKMEKEAESEESEMLELVDGIKIGRVKSKSDEGYFVLKGASYDLIESGMKNIECRDFTESNLRQTIGIKSIRFNRGCKSARQMQWEVKKVVLLDDNENECNPFNVPDDFWPTTIAIHLGKRIG